MAVLRASCVLRECAVEPDTHLPRATGRQGHEQALHLALLPLVRGSAWQADDALPQLHPLHTRTPIHMAQWRQTSDQGPPRGLLPWPRRAGVVRTLASRNLMSTWRQKAGATIAWITTPLSSVQGVGG